MDDVKDIKKLFAAGDAWLMKYGIVSPIMHNNIVLNLYAQFPEIKYLEYFLPQDEDDKRELHLVIHLTTLRCLFTNTNKLKERIEDVLMEYLHDYEISIYIKRYKKEAK